MTCLTSTVLLTVGASLHVQAQAVESAKLAQNKNCLTCHAINTQSMGPSFHEIASKYQARADATDYLAQAIINGKVGVWGGIPMPANTQLSAAEASQLARWILSLNKR